MNILVFSDLHSSRQALEWLERLLSEQKFDLVLSPGDIVDRHNPKSKDYVDQMIQICQRYQMPLKVVFGNNERDEMIAYYEYTGISLHNKSYRKSGYTFVGIGDVEIHPDRIVDPRDLPIKGNILVTHRPPNPSFTIGQSKFANAPAIHIAGHLHLPGFIQTVDKTLVINAPAALKGGAAILQLPQKTVQFIKEYD